ncbi:MAG: class I SAM-dependent methyltransferase [Actinomycetota bacterium]|nr:class I SAM-dependent methyltransferase [Actinomycetota bacterium]
MSALSPRLLEVVDALPLDAGLRVIEIGCGPGAAAREVANRIGPGGHVLAVDRSTKAIEQLRRSCADLISACRLTARVAPVEELELEPREQPYHLAFAVRVGVLDGRRPALRDRALNRIAAMLVPDGRLFIDGGAPLTELALPPSN